ncbi:epithelial cell adhesion molecule [Tachysurus fulvidraco]|uniref:epithelial cell adhesion molecule n=1 Tax=Tachysurus fulvidraco TaxID=1234273 RepID=UPI000F51608D|nr:epithelial cell adhesion molecule [Tachysurus fulvidraco]XP_047668644.1 epithelial cell adhesion molecule [Tachysurus fulvidraco]
MKDIIVLCLLAFVAGAYAQCTCKNMKWANCDGPPCVCTLLLGNNVKPEVKCDTLISKCFLMKAEMYRAKNNLTTRSIGGKPVDSAFLDNDGIYDPECENDGRFKAIQCNNTETCWCVNSAGVRRSDKGDKNIKCEPVETYWVRLEMKHKSVTNPPDVGQLKSALADVFKNRYYLDPKYISEVQYDSANRLIVVDVQKPKDDRNVDLPRMSYYLEKDVKVLPLFKDQSKFEVRPNGNPMEMENILVYYVDEQAPTFTMQKLTGGVIAVIVVVILVVLIGLLVLFFARRQEQAKYSKTPERELETRS